MQRAWPADAVERRPVASLLPYARNARTHSADQVAQIAAAIREWGWTVPVLAQPAAGRGVRVPGMTAPVMRGARPLIISAGVGFRENRSWMSPCR